MPLITAKKVLAPDKISVKKINEHIHYAEDRMDMRVYLFRLNQYMNDPSKSNIKKLVAWQSKKFIKMTQDVLCKMTGSNLITIYRGLTWLTTRNKYSRYYIARTKLNQVIYYRPRTEISSWTTDKEVAKTTFTNLYNPSIVLKAIVPITKVIFASDAFSSGYMMNKVGNLNDLITSFDEYYSEHEVMLRLKGPIKARIVWHHIPKRKR